MNKHTPGPWAISPLPQKTPDDSATGYEREFVYISGPEHIGLATAVWRLDGARSKTCEANARLIAAAPELLEACEGLLNALPSATTHPAIKAARAAISKAKGE